MTKKGEVIAVVKAMRESTSKDDPCWTKADFIVQEWEIEHKPKKGKKNQEDK
jgi:hypothetical protein